MDSPHPPKSVHKAMATCQTIQIIAITGLFTVTCPCAFKLIAAVKSSFE